jgi:hypothetical protein
MLPVRSKRKIMPETANRQRTAYIAAVTLVGAVVLVLQMIWVSKNQYRFAPFALDRIPCEVCGKTGLVPADESSNSKLVMCPACFGVGSHTIRRVDEHDVLCAACEGMGRVDDGTGWRTCRRCEGRGLVRAPDGPEEPVYELLPPLAPVASDPASATNH